jgi:hypothetical protein
MASGEFSSAPRRLGPNRPQVGAKAQIISIATETHEVVLSFLLMVSVVGQPADAHFLLYTNSGTWPRHSRASLWFMLFLQGFPSRGNGR